MENHGTSATAEPTITKRGVNALPTMSCDADTAPTAAVNPEPVPEPSAEAPPEAPRRVPGDPIPESAEDDDPSSEVPRDLTFQDALEAGDDQTILRELYKEVTTIAEGIWTKDIPPPARVWQMVSVSDWYEKGFSDLGLRPLSDFYDIISKVDRKMREGAAKEQLQDVLKEVNFAQTLLALRDMFQKNHI